MYSYPPARMGGDVDDFHGELIADPYRWLETTTDAETVSWIKAENELTESFLAVVPARESIREQLTGLWDYPRAGVPFERGGRWFQSRNPGLAAQPVLYVMDQPGETGRVLLDPNTRSAAGTTAVSAVSVSDDGTLLAYATSDGGSDWLTWRVRDVATGEDLADVIEWSKFSGAAWRSDGSGFFYGAMQPASAGAEYLEANAPSRILFHRIGTPQDVDEVVFAAPDDPEWMPYAEVTQDGRFLVVTIERAAGFETQLHVLDLRDPAALLQPLIGDFESVNVVVTSVGTTFYLVTDHGAERKRLVAVDLESPGREYWREVIGESDDTLESAYHYGGQLVCHYLRDAHSVLRVNALDGSYLRNIPLPGIASLAAESQDRWAISGRPRSDLMHFKATSFTESGAIWQHDLVTGRTRQVEPSSARIDPADFVTEQVLVTSADGTRVPMFLTRRRDVQPTGRYVCCCMPTGDSICHHAVVLPAHGGWIERGGLLAVANLRGGASPARHGTTRAGWLTSRTCSTTSAPAPGGCRPRAGAPRTDRDIGGSNGGLLVGACLTQHPELFGAAVREVGVFDMLRYHQFTIGWAWTSDFGSPDDPEQYRWVAAYSPLHNVRAGTATRRR